MNKQEQILNALRKIDKQKIKEILQKLSKKQIAIICLSLLFSVTQCVAQGYNSYRKKELTSYASILDKSDTVIGDINAPIEVMFMGDFTCGHCAKKIPMIDELIQSKYNSSGLIKFGFRMIPPNIFSLRMAQVLMCFGDKSEKSYDIISTFFKNQTNIILDFDGNILKQEDIIKNIDNLVVSSNIATKDKLDECLKNQEIKKEITDLTLKTVKDNNLNAVPVIFINAKQINLITIDQIKIYLDKIIKADKKYTKQYKDELSK